MTPSYTTLQISSSPGVPFGESGGQRGFWTTNFPPHSLNSLLPNPEADFSYAACEKRWSAGSSGRVISVT
jgi:hypothetical protein